MDEQLIREWDNVRRTPRDARNAWREMDEEQRIAFLSFLSQFGTFMKFVKAEAAEGGK